MKRLIYIHLYKFNCILKGKILCVTFKQIEVTMTNLPEIILTPLSDGSDQGLQFL